ncbi:hypothetical protein LSH36_208g03024 [Paralvinella palmiformis]|uniref:General vesicular transport factor p115 n=1 Tax=Paralvinella palmiformis TaxID=53620 RepID=A0AAD9JP47_9ANNE|nr:hypothetical protein LSH36_208g03024 [Paralvinella palmiformis]
MELVSLLSRMSFYLPIRHRQSCTRVAVLPSSDFFISTVERLCDRVQSSTLLEDRRDAVRALKSLSKKYCLEVGSQAMEILISVLQTDRNDTEIVGYAVETLTNVMCNEPYEEEDEPPRALPEDLGIQFTEMFIKDPENISLLLSLLEEYDFHVRWPTVKLITTLLINKGKAIQEIILTSPMGVSKMMDLLSDSREIIRNDGLLLLIQLTRSNTNIQKIVAFENAFERLLDIIAEEGNSNGGIVVEDCLLLLLNLLKNNSSNQNFFKEGSFINRLPAYFELEPADQSPQGGWSAQKVTNIHLMLQLVRTLVSPNGPQQQTMACQKAVFQCGLLEKLCNILMASGVPADVLTETINTVSEVIRGNQGNQEYFASVLAPSNPPRPAIVVLLMSMVNEKQPFVLRCAVLYCFESFLYKNELGQSQIISTLLPTTAEVNTITAGQLLCGGLFSSDPLSTWFAAVALMHAVFDNAKQKEQLLRVQLATSLGNPPVSLLQQCSNILAQGAKLQTRVGLLMLLSEWLSNCPAAVNHFLSNNANIPFLISQVSASEGDEMELIVQSLCAFLLGICILYNSEQVEGFAKHDLRNIIEKRIGLEQFTDKLLQVSKHEAYSRAAKKPQLNIQQTSDILFDHQFTKLFKQLENEVIRAISPGSDEENEAEKKKQVALEQHESIVEQYKGIIREQDSQLNIVRGELSELQNKHKECNTKVEELGRQIQQLKDQNALLKAQRTGSIPVSSPKENGISVTQLTMDLDAKTLQVKENEQEIEKLKAELTKALGTASSHDHGQVNAMVNDSSSPNMSGDQFSVEDLNRKLECKEEEVKLYKNKYESMSKQLVQLREQMTSGDLQEDKHSLTQRVSELEFNLTAAEIEKKRAVDNEICAQDKLKAVIEEKAALEEKVKKFEKDMAELEIELEEVKASATEGKKDQEDLLILLAEHESKLKTYRDRLKELGEKVEDDLDDDDDDLDGDDDED